MQLLPYQRVKEDVLEALHVSDSGLATSEAKKRLAEHGPNRLTPKKKLSPLAVYLSQFQNSLILILIGAAILIFFVWYFGERDQSDLVEGWLILAIVFLITLLGFVQEYKAEKAVEALKKLLAFKAKVMRDGREQEVDVAELVPGDIVILEEGEKVPADIRLLDVSSLSVSEASLTGESTPVSKSVERIEAKVQIADQKNMVFSGTVITQGRGLGVVTQTGDATEIGKIATFVSEVKEEATPIQKRLDQIGKILGYAVLIIATVVFVFIVFFAEEYAHLSSLGRIIHSFIAAIALAVAAIPEGLPAVVTISLALGTQRMLKRKALVRKLNSIETLGSTDIICADKTGTLTKGEMTVRQLFFDGEPYEVSGTGYETTGTFAKNGKTVKPEPLALLLECGLVCNNAHLEKSGKVIGDPTEAALLVSAAKAGVTSVAKRVREVPFSSERKMMSVLVLEGNDYVVYTKGAPEVVLAHCKRILKGNKEVPLTQAMKQEILEQTLHMSEHALRTLGFAYRPATKSETDLEHDLIFIGLQGMIDPPRAEVKPLIAQCHASGIRVIMITGDHAATAAAVAAEIGIPGKTITGEELDALSASELAKVVEDVSVYARVNPGSKMKIVEALKKHKHIVAMTGDGVNDAPALKKADIGVAMGITGTDVAKEASDMVLMDDHFNTIVSAIEEGRGVFDNIRKFVNYLLSCNMGEVFVVFVSVVLFQHVPLTATMLLWINVITDGLPAVALGMDPAQKGIMRYHPREFQGHIISSRLWIEMIVFGVLLTAGVLSIYWLNIPEGTEEARAAAFMAIVFFELVRLFHIRSHYRTSFFSNGWLIAAVAVSILLQLLIVYVPFLASLFEVQGIDLIDWVYILVGSALAWVLFEFIKTLLDHFIPNKQPVRSRHARLVVE